MDDFLKKLIDEASKHGDVKVIKVEKGCPDHQEVEPKEEPKEFEEIAETNMQLFKAHLEAGFTEEQALELVKCIIK